MLNENSENNGNSWFADTFNNYLSSFMMCVKDTSNHVRISFKPHRTPLEIRKKLQILQQEKPQKQPIYKNSFKIALSATQHPPILK